MIKVVLFDFHNTLATCDGWLELEIKTLPALSLSLLQSRGVVARTADGREEAVERFQALRARVKASGHEVSAQDGVAQVLGEMGINVPCGEVESVVRELEDALLPHVRMLPGVEMSLQQLRDRGYRMGVVSSAGYPPFVEMSLEQLGLRAFFSEVVTSAGEGIYKSNPEIYRRAAGRLGAAPGEAVHVGDHPVFDVQAARRAGLRAVWLSEHARETAELRGEPWETVRAAGVEADAVVGSMEEVAGAIERLSALRPRAD